MRAPWYAGTHHGGAVRMASRTSTKPATRSTKAAPRKKRPSTKEPAAKKPAASAPAFRAASVLWRLQTGAPAFAAAVDDDGLVWVGNLRGEVFTVDDEGRRERAARRGAEAAHPPRTDGEGAAEGPAGLTA